MSSVTKNQESPATAIASVHDCSETSPTGVSEHVCRSCGCTDDHACVVIDAPPTARHQPGTPCWWIEDDLCSACGKSGDLDGWRVWQHGSPEVAHQPLLTLKEKLAFSWVGVAMLVAAGDLAGLL